MIPRLGVLFLMLVAVGSSAFSGVLPSDARLVFAHFKENGIDYGERLYISYSADGVNWITLNGGNSVWQPATYPNSNFRDPAIIYENGFYWVAFTSGSYGRCLYFGLIKSPDLLNWTFVGNISTAIPGATDPLTWNPTFFRDGDGSVHVFVSVSPINGSTYNPIGGMKTYELHPLNADLTSWSSPQLITLPGNNSNEFWCWKEASTYHAIYFNFGAPGVPLVHLTSTNLLSGWSNPQNLSQKGEGPMLLLKPGGGYRLYFEPGNGSSDPGYRYSDCNATFSSFTTPVKVTSSIPMRNGKMIASLGNTTFADWQAQRLSALPAADQLATADPDGDGLKNLAECLLDTDPRAPEAVGPVSLWLPAVEGQQFLGVRYRRRPQIANAAIAVESGTDLAGWSSGAGATAIVSAALMADGTESVYAMDLVAREDAPRRFLRLAVTLSESSPAAHAAPVVQTTAVRAPLTTGTLARRWAPPKQNDRKLRARPTVRR